MVGNNAYSDRLNLWNSSNTGVWNEMKEEIANKLVCPFCPYVENAQRSYTCVTNLCVMWVRTKKGYGDCGLKVKKDA